MRLFKRIKKKGGRSPDARLLDAIQADDHGTVERLLAQGANIDALDEDGQAALHIAAKDGNASLVRLLLRHDVDPNVRNTRGETPLHSAVVKGDEVTVELLLRAGADVTIRHKGGRSPLDAARRLDRTKLVQLLSAELAGASEQQHGGSREDTTSASASPGQAAETPSPNEADIPAEAPVAATQFSQEAGDIVQAESEPEKRVFPDATVPVSDNSGVVVSRAQTSDATEYAETPSDATEYVSPGPGDENPPALSGSVSSSIGRLGADWNPGDTVLDEYRVERILGQGGMGTVYMLVHSHRTDERFAVKRIIVPDEANRRNFLSELQVWTDLPEHAHLAPCRFFRTVGDEIVIFADYFEAGSLSSWIEEGRMTSLEQILDAAIQFAWGLHAAHERGLVHQDVKPGNALLTPEGVLAVSDFGLARARALAGEEPMAGVQASVCVSYGGMTPAYCSPEQADHKPLTHRTDVWSWGASVLEMFAGELFWQYGPAVEESLDAYLDDDERDEDLPPMPSEVVKVLRRCFVPSPRTVGPLCSKPPRP